MPENSKVDRMYQALRKQGKSPAQAARIAQAVTKTSLQTGKPPKTKDKGK